MKQAERSLCASVRPGERGPGGEAVRTAPQRGAQPQPLPSLPLHSPSRHRVPSPKTPSGALGQEFTPNQAQDREKRGREIPTLKRLGYRPAGALLTSGANLFASMSLCIETQKRDYFFFLF